MQIAQVRPVFARRSRSVEAPRHGQEEFPARIESSASVFVVGFGEQRRTKGQAETSRAAGENSPINGFNKSHAPPMRCVSYHTAYIEGALSGRVSRGVR